MMISSLMECDDRSQGIVSELVTTDFVEMLRADSIVGGDVCDEVLCKTLGLLRK